MTNILSAQTRAILGKLDARVEVRVYTSKDTKEAYADFIEVIGDLLNEYQRISAGHLLVSKINMRPDTASEDAAKADGINILSTPYSGAQCLGVVVQCGTNKSALPSLAGVKPQLLEYQLTQCIQSAAFPSLHVVGIISSLPLWGSSARELTPPTGRQAPWLFLNQLKRDYALRRIEQDVADIPEDVQVLLLIAPSNLHSRTQHAINQFILRGGRLLACLDPRSLLQDNAEAPLSHSSGAQPTGMELLLQAWGISFDAAKVLADLEFTRPVTTQGAVRRVPGLLFLDEQGINTNDVVTYTIKDVLLPYPGSFSGQPVEGLRRDILLRSSTNSQLLQADQMNKPGEEVTNRIKPSGTSYAVAVRLTGRFPNAFPNTSSENTGQAQPGAPTSNPGMPHARESCALLIGDSDFLADRFCVQSNSFQGQVYYSPLNGNLTLLENALEQLSCGLNFSLLPDLVTAKRWWRFAQRPPIKLPPSEDLDEITCSVTNLIGMPLEEGKAVLNRENTKESLNVIREFQKETDAVKARLSELEAGKPASERMALNSEQQRVMKAFISMEMAYKEETKQLGRYLQAQIDSLERLHGITNRDNDFDAKRFAGEIPALKARPFQALLAQKLTNNLATRVRAEAYSSSQNDPVKKLPFPFKVQAQLITKGVFRFDSGMNPTPAGLTHPEGLVSKITIDSMPIALTDSGIRDGKISTRDFGELEVFNGPNGLEFYGTERQRKAIEQCIKDATGE